jgi:copper chaperone CopZ
MSPLYLAILTLISTQALVFSACAPYQDEPAPVESTSSERVILSVDNLPCDPCLIKLHGKLRAMKGIESAKAKLGNQDNLEVIYNPKLISLEQIKQAVRDLGKKVS